MRYLRLTFSCKASSCLNCCCKLSKLSASIASSRKNRSYSVAKPVSYCAPLGSINFMLLSVWYELCATPQHIPEALLAKMPPIIAELIEAGSGPIFLLYFFSKLFTCPPIMPGCTFTKRPSSTGHAFRQNLLISTKIPSVILCPLRLVPAALNTSGFLY